VEVSRHDWTPGREAELLALVPNAKPTCMNETRWSSSEIEESEWFEVATRYRARGIGGAEHDNQYSLLDACAECGAGARHVVELRVLRSDISKHAIHDLATGETVVDQTVKDRLVNQGLRGCEFLPVRSIRDNLLVPGRWLLSPDSTAGPAAPASEIWRSAEGCQHCGRDGWYRQSGTEGLLTYSREGLPSDSDLVRAWEVYGKSDLSGRLGTRWFGHQRWLASARYRHAVRSVVPSRAVDFTPIDVV